MCSAKERSECIESLRDVCVHILHSHDGARASMLCAWHGTAKDRKAIVKALKTFVARTACEEHGHMVLLAVADAVDDTKLVGKAILGEMADNMQEVRKEFVCQRLFTFSDQYFLIHLLCFLVEND